MIENNVLHTKERKAKKGEKKVVSYLASNGMEQWVNMSYEGEKEIKKHEHNFSKALLH